MVSLKYVETPQQLFNSKPCTSADEQHRLWYDDIRTIIGDRITTRNEGMPSHTSLVTLLLGVLNVA